MNPASYVNNSDVPHI